MSQENSSLKSSGSSLFRRFWDFNCLDWSLKIFVGLLTLFALAAIILAISSFQSLSSVGGLQIGDGVRTIAIFIIVIMIVILYAWLRFWPDLIGVFVSIEKHTRTNESKTQKNKYFFLNKTRILFRILSVIALVISFYWLLRLVGIPSFLGNWSRPFMSFFVDDWLYPILLYSSRGSGETPHGIYLAIILVGNLLAAFFLLICSDAAGLFDNIERNSRPISVPVLQNKIPIRLTVIRYFRNALFAMIIIKLFITIIYYLFAPSDPFPLPSPDEFRRSIRFSGGSLVFLGYHLRVYDIGSTEGWLWRLPFLLPPLVKAGFAVYIVGTLYELARFSFDWEHNTHKIRDQWELKFMALRHAAAWLDVAAIILGLSSAVATVLIFLSMAKAVGVYSFFIFVPGIALSLVTYTMLSFGSFTARNLLKVEVNLRTEVTGTFSFFGIRTISHAFRISAIFGTCLIVLATCWITQAVWGRGNNINPGPGSAVFIVGSLIAYGFYVLNAALADLGLCLLRIESYVHRGSVKETVDSQVQ